MKTQFDQSRPRYLCRILRMAQGALGQSVVAEAHGPTRTAAQANAYAQLCADDKAMFLPPVAGEPLDYAPNDYRADVQVYGPY